MTPESVAIAEAKAGACYYVLLMLLQRLDSSQPGLIEGMLQGALADFAVIEASGNSSPSLRAVLKETKQLLEQAALRQAPLPSEGGV